MAIWIAVLIVVAGLAVGWRDVARLSGRRIWAISSVSFAESVRRKVLWIAPLAILGIIAITQLQHPVDERDAIRQTIKVCLFATGLVVVISAIILASTNLPKDIDSRVIYTIVTKPTTRLEVVLGKVVGFARVSALILLIMGLFTYGYLRVRAWNLRAEVRERLETTPEGAPNRASLEYYARAGLLETKAVERPDDLQIYGRPPAPGEPLYLAGGLGQYYTVPFVLTAEDRSQLVAAVERQAAVAVINTMSYRWRTPTRDDLDMMRAASVPTVPTEEVPPALRPPPAQPASAPAEPAAAAGGAGGDVLTLAAAPANPLTGSPAAPGSPIPSVAPDLSKLIPATVPADAPAAAGAAGDALAKGKALPVPQIALAFLNEDRVMVIGSGQINEDRWTSLPIEQGPVQARILINPHLDTLFNLPKFYAAVFLMTPAVEFRVEEQPTVIGIIESDGRLSYTIKPAPTDGADPRRPLLPRALSSAAQHGMQIVGRPGDGGTVAVFDFERPALAVDEAGFVTFEFRAGIDRGGDATGEEDVLPTVRLEWRDPETMRVTASRDIRPESNRTVYLQLKRSEVSDGDFQVLVRVATPGQTLGLRPDSVVMAKGDRPFAFNLAKSLLILWLLSVLVVAIAVFCSTFVSWPIAVVLTVLMLLGRWAVEQIGDTSGLGSTIAQVTRSEAGSRVIRTGVDTLQSGLQVLASVLPDISKFAAIEDIARGVNIPWATLGGAALVLLGYGLPLVVLAYVRLKYREVAL